MRSIQIEESLMNFVNAFRCHHFLCTRLLWTRFGVLACIVFGLLSSCAEEPRESPSAALWRRADSLRELRRTDSIRKAARAKIVHDSVPKVTYKRLAITSRARLDSIRATFGKNHYHAYRAFTTVNRKDIQFFRVGDTALIPSAIHQDLRVYSVFPHLYPAADTIARLIVVSNKLQAYACYEKGKLVRFAACNTGSEQKPTFPGRYALNWRDKLRHSSLDSTWELPWTWNFHLEAGSAFHQFEMPGRPVSHSCVRQFMDDAEWLFKWGRGARLDTSGKRPQYVPYTGTPVIITDVFDYRRKKGGPWWELTSNRSMLKLPAAPMDVEEALIPISQIPEDVRWSLRNKERYVSAEDTLRKRGVIREQAQLLGSINYNKLRREQAKALARAEAVKAAKAARTAASEAALTSEPTAGDIEEAALRETFMPETPAHSPTAATAAKLATSKPFASKAILPKAIVQKPMAIKIAAFKNPLLKAPIKPATKPTTKSAGAAVKPKPVVKKTSAATKPSSSSAKPAPPRR